jgi:hypothetical protein
MGAVDKEAGRPGFYSRQGYQICLHSTASRPALRPTKPPLQWIPGALSPGVKRPGLEADHSSISSAEVNNCGAVFPLPYKPWCRSLSMPWTTWIWPVLVMSGARAEQCNAAWLERKGSALCTVKPHGLPNHLLAPWTVHLHALVPGVRCGHIKHCSAKCYGSCPVNPFCTARPSGKIAAYIRICHVLWAR